MTANFFKITIFAIIFIFGMQINKTSFSFELSENENQILPIASFLFTQNEPMRVGWYFNTKLKKQFNFQEKISKPTGSLFVQLKPRKFEDEYALALRILKGGSNEFKRIKEFSKGKELNHKQYITIPFEFLNGPIQGEALRSLFPKDQVDFGGWSHHFTYNWETPELIAKYFTKSKISNFPKKKYKQGEKIIIPWQILRSDLELQPLAIREPLFIKKDESGVRYAFYRFLLGDTLYSSVLIRFIGHKKHQVRNQNVIDLLKLNGLKDAHQISKGQIIKIPLQWIKPEYFHYIPSIYKNYFDSNAKKTSPDVNSLDYILPNNGEKYNNNFISKF